MFAKQPIPGRVKTRLAADWGDDRAAAALYECFVRDQTERFASLGDRRVIGFAPDTAAAHTWFKQLRWDLWPQPETDLGGRISAFFTEYCATADDRTILIGSDSPSIPDECLEDAWSMLDGLDCVIGPATDGGYWLIGLRGPADRALALFEGIQWSSSAVYGQTMQRVHDLELRLGVLPVWYDIDSAESVSQLQTDIQDAIDAGVETGLPRTTAFLSEFNQQQRGTADESRLQSQRDI